MHIFPKTNPANVIHLHGFLDNSQQCSVIWLHFMVNQIHILLRLPLASLVPSGSRVFAEDGCLWWRSRVKSAFRLQSETIMSASSSAQNVAFRWIFFNMHSSSLTTEPLCSVLRAAPLLSRDRWDGFNLIIAADVGFEYFLKHLLSHEKLNE